MYPDGCAGPLEDDVDCNGEEKYKFIVKAHSNDYFLIEAPYTITIKEQQANFVLGYTHSRIPAFVFNLIISVVPGFDDFQILSQDTTFIETLEKTKIRFINQCEMLAKEQKTNTATTSFS